MEPESHFLRLRHAFFKGESIVTVHPRQSNRSASPGWDGRRRATYHTATGSSAGYTLAVILLLVLVLLCLAGLVLARAFLTDPSPSGLAALVTRTPLLDPIGNGRNQSQITIDPEHGYIGSLITVTGQGWWPGEPVFVFLRSEEEGEGPGYAYAAAVADEQGQFHTALTFPNEVRWIRAQWASSRGCDVIARGTRSELEASTRFSIVAPLPTAVPRGTAVTTPPPTPPPTSLPAHTPTATAAATATTFAAPTATPTPATISDWRGEYFANAGLAGDPVLIRNDLAVGFFWGTGSPGKGVPADRFSVRWTRLLHFAESTYRFAIAADDGVRFWIDGQLVVDDWQDGPLRPHALDLYLSEDEHTLRVEYYENLGDAGIQFGWEQIAQPTATPTPPPTPVLPPTDTPTLTPVPTDIPAPTPTPTTTVAPTDTQTPIFETTMTRVPWHTPPPPLPDAWQAQY